jgi:uncharacterized protein (TIGR02145 family)
MKKTNSLSLFFLLQILVILPPGCKKDEPEATTVSDIDGNIYDLVTIGSQTWIRQNLKTTRYNDGTQIAYTPGNSGNSWESQTSGAYCWYNNDEAQFGETYGTLYNWQAVNSGKLCPAGWHIPTKNEWTSLYFDLQGPLVAGGKLKEADTIHWAGAPPDSPPYPLATNESGFTALPGGSRSGSVFSGLRTYGAWWTSTSDNSDNSWAIILYGNSEATSINSFNRKDGFSVRCIHD